MRADGLGYVGHHLKTVYAYDVYGHQHTEQRNPFGQLRSTKDNLGNEVFFTYDVMENLTRTSNSYNNQVIVNTYDSWGRKVSTTDPDKGTWRYKYNHYGELIEQTDAIGHRFDFTYDSLGRMVRRYSPSEGTSCWRYGSTSHRNIHASGKLLSKSLYTSSNITCSDTRYTPSSQESYIYDDLGLVSGITRLINGQTFSESMTYNNLGQVSEITYPTGTEAFTVTHEYDDVGDLRYVRHKSTNTLLWQASAFNRRGLIAKATFGNNTTTDYGYTTEGFHETSATKRNHTLLHESVVTLDDAGNVTQRESEYRASNGLIDSFTETYAYDALNRLTSRGFAQDKRGYTPSHFNTSVTYRYDNAGNMTYKSDVGTYHYDSTKPNRLVKVTNYRGQQIKAFTYDNNGNVKAETNLRGFRYTAFDKPYRISHRNGAVVDMSYNIDRNMVFKRDSRKVLGTQTTTEHYYAGGYEKIVQTQGRSRGLVEHKYHLMGGNIVITHRSNGTKDTHYLHKDTQGSVSLITNESGSVIAQYIYDPFGKQTTLSTNSMWWRNTCTTLLVSKPR